MAYGYPYPMQQPVMPSYFNTNYAPTMPQMQQQTPAANVTWIYVNGWDGARNQIVQPGQTAWMMDNNDPVIYIKAVDSMGSANLRAFKLTIRLREKLRICHSHFALLAVYHLEVQHHHLLSTYII